ncbi:MAG: antitoxin [Lentisphaerae bacterium RIFOXYB12_FULL_65_16]|nr:MAG: antitoxin [Lentisphaerae bacterium RIFOXYA12_64_32]OGV86309.1 MAG: antitoxin [Lentisphaerae bacterium RIFOXYB12_FULL_65_16]
MNTMTYTAARANLARTIDRVCQDHEPVLIRKRNESVVMMSLEDFEGWAETIYLLRSPKNARRLQESVDAANQGDLVCKSMKELLDAER